MIFDDFLDSVIVEELDTIPMDLLEEIQQVIPTSTPDYWSTRDIAPR